MAEHGLYALDAPRASGGRQKATHHCKGCGIGCIPYHGSNLCRKCWAGSEAILLLGRVRDLQEIANSE